MHCPILVLDPGMKLLSATKRSHVNALDISSRPWKHSQHETEE